MSKNKTSSKDSNLDVQSVVFYKDNWTPFRARKWLKKHDFEHTGKVDITKNTLRFRQTKPDYDIYRSKKIEDHGIVFVFGIDE